MLEKIIKELQLRLHRKEILEKTFYSLFELTYEYQDWVQRSKVNKPLLDALGLSSHSKNHAIIHDFLESLEVQKSVLGGKLVYRNLKERK